ncbi:hypothetical protein [Halorarius litoreus]|uniref:hypothetical protein n=1 Tax=Halorarius litoreus TaxID=2962676 RepID=UPI0020CC7B99|nr:hypothetical protein [Halorarius litoreus]
MSSAWSRRSVLAATGAVGAAALVPTASARYTTRMVIPSADGFTGDEDLVGYFVHLGSTTDVSTDPADVDGCGFENWSPTDLSAFDGRLLDRLDEDHRETEMTVHVAGDAEVDTGTLWIINGTVECPDGQVGLEVEQVGASVPVSTAESTPSSAIGPGFGPLAAVGGLLAGVAALARRHRSGE